jgi:uncharacterized protein (TIRG00374 family)
VKATSKSGLWIRAVVLAAFIAVMIWAIARLDWPTIGHKLASASLREEAMMAVCWIVTLLIRPLRLLVLAKAMAPENERRYWPMWSANVIAMATNNVIPMRAGDVMMAFVLRQSLGISTARASSLVVVDRFFDFATVIVLFVSMLSLAPMVVPWADNLTVTLVAALVVLAGGLCLAIRTRRFWLAVIERLLSGVNPKRAQRWNAAAHELFDGFAQIESLRVVGPVLLFSILQWAMTVLTFWFGIRAVWPAVPISAAAFSVGAVALSFVVPVAPGGVGVFHGAVALALSLFAVPVEPALAFAIVAHAFQLGSVLVFATIALICQGISLRSLVAARGSSP